MLDNYKRMCYDEDMYLRVHHTIGEQEKESIIRQYHYDPYYIIDYFKNACGVIRIEGKHYKFDAGDIAIISPSELHVGRRTKNEADLAKLGTRRRTVVR